MWTKYLPYHVARVRHLRKRLASLHWHLTAIEVASKDALYPFPESQSNGVDDYVCLFSGKSYRALSPSTIHKTALRALERLQPDVVIAPATPFPSGMAAVRYCLDHSKMSVMMDDAWEMSDRRGIIVSAAKKIIHRNIDAAFIPAPTHASYYIDKGFPPDRIVFGVDAVDNDFYSSGADLARQNADSLRRTLQLPAKFFVFVGRFIPRKGIATLLEAYRSYADSAKKDAWGLVLVGEGDERNEHEDAMKSYSLVKFVGGQFGEQICPYYGLASAFILPSEIETWGLVVNEAMASRLPVLVSNRCGAGRALVEEGVNGWTFDPGNPEMLIGLMTRMSQLPAGTLHDMGVRSKAMIDKLSLDNFADSVIRAAQLPPRHKGGFISNLVTRFWTGRISFYP